MEKIAYIPLPNPGTQCVLGFGAWLKNTVCLLQADKAYYSVEHGDLGSPQARLALQNSVADLVCSANGHINALAHDLHPDFYSTQLALEWGQRLDVPVFGVQHHAAHIAAVLAEHGVHQPALGLAFDGVGLGDDGSAWGGEVLLLKNGGNSQRLDHITALALPGGDRAAVDSWRMGASLLTALDRKDEVIQRFGARVGNSEAKTLVQMLDKGINCPLSTGCGRWFDAMAALLLGIDQQEHEAQAAIALEQSAQAWFDDQAQTQRLALLECIRAAIPSEASEWLNLLPLAQQVLTEPNTAKAAACFHLGLAERLVMRAEQLARAHNLQYIVLAGGCFFNTILREHTLASLQNLGLTVLLPQQQSFGDSGLALGQAWIAAQRLKDSGQACMH